MIQRLHAKANQWVKHALIMLNVMLTYHAEYKLFGRSPQHASQEERLDPFVNLILIAKQETFAGNNRQLKTASA
jgi:hypothetical protein